MFEKIKLTKIIGLDFNGVVIRLLLEVGHIAHSEIYNFRKSKLLPNYIVIRTNNAHFISYKV